MIPSRAHRWPLYRRSRRHILHFALLLAAAIPGRTEASDEYHNPESISVVSPQIGVGFGSGPLPVLGFAASHHRHLREGFYAGAGLGAYLEDGRPVGEFLLKGSWIGFVGASVGPSYSSEGFSVANDLWVNMIFAGLRWRMDHRPSGTVHSVSVFAPLWWLFLERSKSYSDF